MPTIERRIFTLSNLITLSRILILPFILILIKASSTPENKFALGLCVVWVFASDFLDGYIARQLDQVSLVGKVLDPVSDKLATLFTAVFTSIYKGLPVWVAAVIIVRDILILATAVWVMKAKRFVTVSNIYGKWAVTFIGLLIVSYMFEVKALYTPLTVLAMLGVAVSAVAYCQSFIHVVWQRSSGR